METVMIPKRIPITSHEFMISDNLWEYSDRGDEVSENLQEESHEGNLRIFPEELVEKILAMVPFPYVFKARVLSRSWLARLSPISSAAGDDKKRLAVSFQKQIREWSTNWKAFCPVHLDRSDDLAAYHRPSYTWQRLPSLSFLPAGLVRNIDEQFYQNITLEGALLSWRTVRGKKEYLYVANILTQSWKQLPPRPHWKTLRFGYGGRIFLSHKAMGYEVILMLNTIEGQNFVQIYDSVSASWRSTEVASPRRSPPYDAAEDAAQYADGVLYVATVCDTNAGFIIKILAVNIKDETLAEECETVAELHLKRGTRIRKIGLLICNTTLLIILVFGIELDFIMAKIDLQRRQLLGCPCPPKYPYSDLRMPVTDGTYVFAQLQCDGSGVLAYNVHADRWDLLPYCMELPTRNRCFGGSRWWKPYFYFRPGLNPFVAL